MSSADPLAVPRLGATFRLLMQVRILVAIVSLVLIPGNRQTVSGVLILIGVGLLSALALFSWQQLVPPLLKYPVLLGFDVFAAYTVLQIGGVTGPFFLFTVVTSAVAGLLHGRNGMLLFCSLQILLYYTAAVGANGAELINFQTTVAMPGFYLIAGFVGIGLRRLYDQQAVADGARHRAEVSAAAAEERARLAREMHDSLAKTLRGIAMSAEALPAWVTRSPARAQDEARRIAEAAEIASREARQLIEDLRDEVFQQPLAQGLESIARDWADETGTALSITIDAAADLPVRARYEVVAILREALENVRRHAEATAVQVFLRNDDDGLVLSVQDDGRGFEAADGFGRFARKGHYGLVGMGERAHSVGASLSVDSRPGGGTTVTIGVPEALGPAAERTDLEVA
ncbi:sensor histidine kinase [Actinomadura sp. 9N407]|uniref:sensor histidine kinase n=1 Tax=Actinomadura sp. 9N407 TaxID=3375154 RepID=UPI0037A2E144